MIHIGIYGWGNLGKAVADNLPNFPDVQLKVIFSRRPQVVAAQAPKGVAVASASDMEKWTDKIDVLLLCSGSATDLPEQTPAAVKLFNVVDSFDTHANIPTHFAAVDKAAKASSHLGLISAGWDPGLFSLSRALFNAFLPNGADYTFWGKGVSQGHSDAIRRVAGVKRGVQYTVPRDTAIERVRSGEQPALSTREKHLRECFVVAENGADCATIEAEIKNMPNYFADYDTVVHFISEEEFERDHKQMPHGGFVLRSGNNTEEYKSLLELNIKLDSNSHFTSGVLLAYARAVKRLFDNGARGCITVFDVPPSALFAGTPDDMRKHLL
ncbi:MAG: diaminopimelate dehydrogenase [Clostridiales bacterium]|nr:diaminopimelate dehydrogenase [Clostridiales bacterium]